MNTEEWLKFKSGSDIRGVAYEGGGKPVDLTDEVVSAITHAFYGWLLNRTGRSVCRVAVGHDSRLSAPRLRKCVIDTLAAAGAEAVDCGLCGTPAMFMITLDGKSPCDAAIQLTASHHPFDKNGMKFFTPKGGLEGDDVADILTLASRGRRVSGNGSVTKRNYMKTYAAGLVSLVRTATGQNEPLSGLRIVVDAGNGAGGFFVDDVLKVLGADTAGSQFLEPDGRFPNHIPNPENAEAMRSVCNAVVRNGADLGIIFDTDVDRAGAVDSRGREINRNRLIALMFSILNAEKRGVTVVTDSVTGIALTEFIEASGGKHRRFKRGYKNVINECIRLNAEGVDCPLAIETSGHAALRENYFLDDGAYLITRILIELAACKADGRDLLAGVDDPRRGLIMPDEEAEIRLGFKTEDFAACGEKVMERVAEEVKRSKDLRLLEPSYEGIRVSMESEAGRSNFVLRMSVHDPIMPINFEGYGTGLLRKLAVRLHEMLAPFRDLDLQNLEKLISEEK